jgi:hypothetical protein
MSTAGDRMELTQLEQEWMSAMQSRDMERLEELVAPGFRFTAIHLYPEPMSREQWMGAAREGYTITSFAFEHMDIEVFGARRSFTLATPRSRAGIRTTCPTCSG